MSGVNMYSGNKGGYRKKKSLHTGGLSKIKRRTSHTGGSKYGAGREERSDRGGRDQPNRKGGNEDDNNTASGLSELEESRREYRLQRQAQGRAFDDAFGFEAFTEGPEREGWLLNFLPTTVQRDGKTEEAALDVYFLQQDGETFRVTIIHEPYFYIRVPTHFLKDVVGLLERRFDGQFSRIEQVEKVDLEFPNHLAGEKPIYLKLSFTNVQNLMTVRKLILQAVEKNGKNRSTEDIYANFVSNGNEADIKIPENIWEVVVDIREYDVPYYQRAAIDLGLRSGAWYDVECLANGVVKAKRKVDMLVKAEPRVLAFDIECTKAPLKFPNAEVDQIFMISYMFDGQGYLIINREVVSEDIDDFEYTPKPQYPGPFVVFNEVNEKDLLVRFFEHCQELRPNIWVTYNGDFFDWPFVEKRASKYGIKMENEIGVSVTRSGEYRGRCSVHMDAFSWVQRDSYLPQGSRGLKAVTKYKLGYNPVEVAPEEMVKFASEQPQRMAAYSVSDAVATYYLYMKYVHNFIFSLCTIIPMIPEDVLRKGSGTLCEMLLMVEAYEKNIIAPNKQKTKRTKFHKRQLLESETYIGGHVESLLAGVYRNDLPEHFDVDPTAFDELISKVDRDLTFVLEVEEGKQRADVTNYDEVKNSIIETLEKLRDQPRRKEEPVIYHLDVAAMYPNIILTNRLQPTAIVDDSICATCDFNRAENACKRKMTWTWRGDMYPSTRSEYNSIKNQVEHEMANELTRMSLGYEANTNKDKNRNINMKQGYREQTREQALDTAVRKRLKTYCQTVYKKVKVTVEEDREDVVCQRENPFYVDTVRAFRDRRYKYKKLTKKWAKEVKVQERTGDQIKLADAKNKSVLYDSLQLAHKCILNSFYGYVMRRGARWYSMPMAGIVTKTGADLIKQARELVERIGRPLELDTDGIWCILPSSFPENYKFKFKDGSKLNISYPCVMLNADVHQNYTNDQYQTLVDKSLQKYDTKSECSIFFEVDGPYRCMVLPASQEKGKLLKKRYAVFNDDGSLAELKGFEIKRRGELQIIKLFQGEVFEKFLNGETIEECYAAVGEVGKHWLNILLNEGGDLEDEELIDLISENKNMSKTMAEYGDRKSTSITVAKRLAQFLGAEMIKDKGLNCRMVISKYPIGGATSERAVPTAIFSADMAVRKKYLKKWSKKNDIQFGIRDILDWAYYTKRLASNIQKIITIPAGLQKVPNPIPKIVHPDWLLKADKDRDDPLKQKKISDMFKGVPIKPLSFDIEDIGRNGSSSLTSNNLPKGNGAATIFSSSNSNNNNRNNNNKNSGNATMNVENNDPNSFDGWLKQRKSKWKAKRLERKRIRNGVMNGRHRGGGGDGDESSNSNNSNIRQGVAAFYRGQTRAIMEHYWQIIEVRETIIPGTFDIFALTGAGSMQKIRLNVPRVLYINSRVPHDTAGRLVKRYLPHGKNSQFVYEFVLEETKYQRNPKELSNFLTHPDFEGVYERHTPLLFRVLVRLGCVARVSNSASLARRRAKAGSEERERPYNLDEMEFLTTATNNYLDENESKNNIKRIYLYHSRVGDRGVVGFFFIGQRVGEEGENYLAESCVWVVDKGKKKNGEENQMLPKLNATFKRFAPKESKCAFQKLRTAISVDECLQEASEYLAKHREIMTGPAIVLAESPLDLNHLTSTMQGLHDLPVILIRANENDSKFPALNWQQYGVERMMQRYLLSHAYFFDRLQCAQYSHIPVGNMSFDFACDMADVFMARMLRANKHLYWASKSPKPDVGVEEGNVIAIRNILDVEEKCICSEPGAYRSICVEVDIFNLAVNTVLEASTLADIEGNSEAFLGEVELDFNNEGGTGGNSNISTGVAFKILRNLVSTWFREVKQHDNQFADLLLMHFYRWLCSPASLLCDPALHHMVQRMMNKVFMNLIGEFRKLGSKIIFASFNKLIIATNKQTLDAAQEYVNFIVDTVQARQLFSRMHLQPKKFWSTLLYNDIHNYGGILLHSSEDNEDGNNVDETMVGDDGANDRPDAEYRQSSANAVSPGSGKVIYAGNSETDLHGNLEGFVVGDDEEDIEYEEVKSDDDDDDDKMEDEAKDGDNNNNNNDDDDEEEEDALQRRSKRQKKKKNRRKKRVEKKDDQFLSEMENAVENALAQRMDVEDEDNDDIINRRNDNLMEIDEDLKKISLLAHWNLVDYLPEQLQEPFEVIIGEFILKPWKWRKKELEKRRKDAEAGKAEFKDISMEEYDAYVRNFVSTKLTKRLYDLVPQIRTHFSTEPFPSLPGSYLNFTNPALEFTKAVCQVLNLDASVTDEVQLLKRNTLRLLNVREFSQDAIWKDPCRSYVLKDVICTYCNYCQDLDLARDPSLVHVDQEQSWRCPQCDNKYDKNDIEYLLVELVNQRTTAYQTQDLRCEKSQGCQDLLMTTYNPSTSKGWVCDYTETEIRNQFKTFLRIAQFHNFEWLEETARTVLQYQ
jgi:DNA polymerase epsilon subunit 1